MPVEIKKKKKRASDPPELELGMVINCYVHAGNQTQDLFKSSQGS